MERIACPLCALSFASHAFDPRKICSAVKKAALSEQRIINSFSFSYTHEHHQSSVLPLPCEFAAFRLSKFFFPSARLGVWGNRNPQGLLGTFGQSKVPRRQAKPDHYPAREACLPTHQCNVGAPHAPACLFNHLHHCHDALPKS